MDAIHTFTYKFVLRNHQPKLNPHPTTSTRCDSARIASAYTLIRDHSSSDLSTICSAFTGHIYSIRPAKLRSPFIGSAEVNEKRLNHDQLQRLYTCNPKAAMDIIRPKVKATAKSSPQAFTDNVNEHNRATLFVPDSFDCPISRGAEFDFQPPSSIEIVELSSVEG